MWDDERSAGVALRAIYDEPTPPQLTTLDEVLRRGRRRVRVHRFGMLALVVSLVAAAGLGTMWLQYLSRGHTAPPVNGMAVAFGPEEWPENLPGWTVVATTTCLAPAHPMPVGVATVLPKEVLEPTFVTSVSAVTGLEATLRLSEWSGTNGGYVEVDVPVDNSFGSVQLFATVSESIEPVQAANADVNVYGTCSVPMRKVLTTGAVIQLYAPDVRSPFAPVQRLRTYLPNGRFYEVTSAGWSRDDLRAVAGDPTSGLVQTGRGRLPLDSTQLADVAVRLVDVS